MYNLVTAAAATGASKSTIFRSIKAGRLSAGRNETGGWEIDPAELHRVFPPLPTAAGTGEKERAERDALANQLVAELRSVIADLRQDRDGTRRMGSLYGSIGGQAAGPLPMDRPRVGRRHRRS
jgi:hypothetical protein